MTLALTIILGVQGNWDYDTDVGYDRGSECDRCVAVSQCSHLMDVSAAVKHIVHHNKVTCFRRLDSVQTKEPRQKCVLIHKEVLKVVGEYLRYGERLC